MTTKPVQVEKLEKGTFVLICLDGPQTADLRREHMFGHLEHIENNNSSYRVAGPLKDAEKGIMGSFFMVAADTEEEARNILEGDPYMHCGLFESVKIFPFIPSCGQWMGGVTWDQNQVRADIQRYV